ncbi:MAG: cold-shock protein [Sphingomonadales bacterium]|jgi:CspA family cold shock protein|nr:cold-shock protein [Sphingomonadales bacterium]
MGFDRGRRGDRGGRGRDKFDSFGDDSYSGGGGFGGDRFGGGGAGGGFRAGGDRFGGGGGGGDRFGGGGGDRFGGGGGGGFRGGGGAGGGRPQMPAQVVGEGRGKVKFFNGQKGFGFISPEDGSADIFVHISAVEQAGLSGLGDGQDVAFTMVDRGGRVSATELKLEGDVVPVSERAPREDRGAGGFGDRGGDRGGFGGGDRGGFGGAPRRAGPQRQLTGEKATGTVKFFNAMKGFGFVQRDDGQPDVFVHISAVERAGMSNLNEGDRIEFDIEVDGRGKYAAVNITSSS